MATERLAMTAEQRARDMLERMGWDEAQERSAGEVVEVANLISFVQGLKERITHQHGFEDLTLNEQEELFRKLQLLLP